jgi:hypothetical protein
MIGSIRRSLQRPWSLRAGTRAFLQQPLSAAQAESEIRAGLARRGDRFLELVRSGVFESPRSPYRRLFQWAGCEYGDLERGVRRDGLDHTLAGLARHGVYLTSDEFRGKQPVVRGGGSFPVTPDEFLLDQRQEGWLIRSSGTMSRPLRSVITPDWLAQRSLATAVFFRAHGLYERVHAIYDGIFPSGPGVNNVLIYARLGVPVERWFTPGSLDHWAYRGYYRVMTSILLSAVSRHGPGPVRVELVPPAQVTRIVRWVEAVARRGRRVCLTTAASNATRIARAALAAGVSLEGTIFIATGEPLTEAKRRIIVSAGATAVPRFAYGGGVNVGFGCAYPAAIDDLHVNEHLLALLAHPQPLAQPGAAIHPLLCTTLHAAAPHLLINVESGDYATLSRRVCGCALGAAGLTLHVHGVRSFEKLTSEGMNYYNVDLFALLEQTLPVEFGGGPGDYQLVEEEDAAGQTRLTLRVAPAVGPVDEARILARVHEELARGPRGNRLMGAAWRRVRTLRVSREVPFASPRGKVLPLHIPR